jgi:hypothetical protein
MHGVKPCSITPSLVQNVDEDHEAKTNDSHPLLYTKHHKGRLRCVACVHNTIKLQIARLHWRNVGCCWTKTKNTGLDRTGTATLGILET